MFSLSQHLPVAIALSYHWARSSEELNTRVLFALGIALLVLVTTFLIGRAFRWTELLVVAGLVLAMPTVTNKTPNVALKDGGILLLLVVFWGVFNILSHPRRPRLVPYRVLAAFSISCALGALGGTIFLASVAFIKYRACEAWTYWGWDKVAVVGITCLLPPLLFLVWLPFMRRATWPKTTRAVRLASMAIVVVPTVVVLTFASLFAEKFNHSNWSLTRGNAWIAEETFGTTYNLGQIAALELYSNPEHSKQVLSAFEDRFPLNPDYPREDMAGAGGGEHPIMLDGGSFRLTFETNRRSEYKWDEIEMNGPGDWGLDIGVSPGISSTDLTECVGEPAVRWLMYSESEFVKDYSECEYVFFEGPAVYQALFIMRNDTVVSIMIRRVTTELRWSKNSLY